MLHPFLLLGACLFIVSFVYSADVVYSPEQLKVIDNYKALVWAHQVPNTTDSVDESAGSGLGNVLVILFGQMRGGELAWKSLEDNVLRHYEADLAYIGPSPYPEALALLKRLGIKYMWEVPEYADFGSVLDEIITELPPSLSSGAASSNYVKPKDWRKLCALRGQVHVFSGISPCPDGSAGILLAYRYLLMKRVVSLGLAKKYDWFFFTRTDYLYLCAPPPITAFNKSFVYFPRGETYGGFTDRMSMMPASLLVSSLNITSDLVLNTDFWADQILFWPDFFSNIESAIRVYFTKALIPVQTFNHTGALVKRDVDPTRSRAHGNFDFELFRYGLSVKYPRELVEATKVCFAEEHATSHSWGSFHAWARSQGHNQSIGTPSVLLRCSKQVFLFANDTLHAFQSRSAFDDGTYSFDDVKMLPCSKLASMPKGNDIL